MKSIIRSVVLIGFASIFLPIKLSAQGLCDFVPCGQCADGSCNNAFGSLENYIRLGFTLIFAIILILGIIMIVRGVLKIIRSEGDDAKVKEGTENIRGVMFGVIILFVGIIGIVLITILFNVQGTFSTQPQDPELIEVPIL